MQLCELDYLGKEKKYLGIFITVYTTTVHISSVSENLSEKGMIYILTS